MAEKFDVIIIGAGPNGLAIGAYLSKAGQKVLLLEKRLEEGGGLMTEQVTLPDFYHNTHAIYKMMVDYAPVYPDFQLEEKYGVQHIFPELQCVMPLRDGRALCLYRDLEKTCASLAAFSPKDAASYRKMVHRFEEMMREILGPQTYAPMEAAPIMGAKMEQTELGRELSAFAEMTPEEIVCEYFENDLVRTLMLYQACHWGLDYGQSGVSYMVPLYLNRMVNYRITAGGSHRVSNALYKFIFENQGQIRQSVRLKRILVEKGQAKGVELEDGRQFLADKAVVSTIDPHQTFLDYVGEKHLDPDFTEMIKMYQWEKWSLTNLHLALAEPPRFRAAEKDPELNRALIYLVGYESLAQLKRHWDAMEKKEMPADAGFICSFPSVLDPYQAPPGKASGLISQMAVFDLKDGGSEKWLNYRYRQETTERLLDVLGKYAPNVNRDTVLETYLTTPTDIQNKYADMVKGGYKQGAYHPLQMGFLRPNQDCSHYRTPVKSLYVGGASVAPGGMIIWGPGYNCANAIAEDFGIQKWWSEPEIVKQARQKGYI